MTEFISTHACQRMEPEFPLSQKVAEFETKGGPLVLKYIPLEYPKHSEVLVKVLACGVCFSDTAIKNQLPQSQ